MIRRVILILLLSCITSHANLSSQNGPVKFQDVGVLEEYTNPQVTSLYQDCRGLLWISTHKAASKHLHVSVREEDLFRESSRGKLKKSVTPDDENIPEYEERPNLTNAGRPVTEVQLRRDNRLA